MAGLILLVVLVGWGFITYLIVFPLTQSVMNLNKRKIIRVILMPLVFLLPVADEIVGQIQFRSLCSEEVFFVDQINAKNTDIYLDGVGDEYVGNGLLQIMKEKWIYRDAKTHHILVSWSVIKSNGGWLSRFIGFPEGNPPYTFDGTCSPDGSIDFDELNLRKVKRDSVIGRK